MTTIDKAQQKQVLTAYLQASLNDMEGFIASAIAPSMPVLRRTGERFSWGRQAMRVLAGKRAVGGRYKKVDFDVEKVDTWSLVDNGFFTYVLQEELDNKELTIQASQAKAKLMLQIMMLNYEEAVASAITTSTITNNSTPVTADKWDKYTSTASDVIGQIEDAKETVRKASGKKPNSIALSRPAFVALKRHPNIQALFLGVDFISDKMLEERILRDIFGFKYVHIGESQYEDRNLTAGSLGGTGNFTDIRGEKALIYYKKEDGELWDTMFMRTFEMKIGIQGGTFATTQEQQLTEKKMSGVVTSHERDIVILDEKCAYLFDDVLT